MALDASNKRRIAEALECLKKADSHLKTSFIKLKFKPDFDSAAIEYERAAVCYRNASDFNAACDCYLKAAEMHFSSGNLFHSAKDLENAATIYKELGDIDNAVRQMEIAINRYAESGTLDTAAMALDKAAKLFENSAPEKAIDFYNKAIEMVLQTDHARMVDDFLTRLTRIHLKLEHYKEAADCIKTAIEKFIDLKETGKVGQLTLGAILIQLAREDSVAANFVFQKSLQCNDFSYSSYAQACQSLITAYDSGDVEEFRRALGGTEVRSMDNEYLRLAKKLMSVELEGGLEVVHQETKVSPEGDNTKADSENCEEEDDDDDLK